MRCMACGAEMRLVQVVPDDTMMVAGYERHTLQCTGCNDVERRLVFSRQKTPVDSVPAPPTKRAEPDSERQESKHQESKHQTERVAAPSAWARAVAMFRGRHPDKGS
jgi:hypothetical protein